MMDTVRVTFLRGTSLGDGRDARPGDVVDLDRRLFAQFAQQGRVVEVASADSHGAQPPAPRKGKKNA